ncbi:GEVED domain-containing protein [Taibaiella soli]|nr:GEVED domain-containing protein [Taibaiella soli]
MELPCTRKNPKRYGNAKKSRRWGQALVLFFTAAMGVNKASAYCNTSLGGGSSNSIDSIAILGTTLNNGSPGAATGYYTDYSSSTLAYQTASIMQGQTYTLHAVFGTAAISSLWIDYDNSGTFDASEWVQITTTTAGNDVQFTVPLNAAVGTVGMRVRSRATGNLNGPNDACTNFGSGETEDYVLTIVAAPPCTGVPVAGTTVLQNSPCYNTAAILGLTGSSIASGLTYSWQTFQGGNWVDVTGGSGANTSQYITDPVTTTEQYRCKVKCNSVTPDSSYSSALTVAPSYGAMPYTEDFESIVNDEDLPGCVTTTSYYVNTYISATGYNNMDNHTPNGSKYAWFQSGCSDYMFTDALNLTANTSYQISFWYVTDGYQGWNTLQAAVGTQNLASAMTLIGNPVTNPANQTYKKYTAIFTPTTTGAYYFGIYCDATWYPSALSFDDIHVEEMLPCSGQPTAGSIDPGGPVVGCPGSTFDLTTDGTSIAANLTYQWLQHDNTTTAWTPVATGGTTDEYMTAALSDTMHYCLKVTCTTSGLSDTTGELEIDVPRMQYAALPYLESFENWTDHCATADNPDSNWTNIPAEGENSWRRDDQGGTAGWYPYGPYSPVSVIGQHSATFASTNAMPGQKGTLDVYVDCSSLPGNKDLIFDFNNNSGSDSLNVYLSTDAGFTFTQLGAYNVSTSSSGWDEVVLPINSNNPKCVIRFEAVSDWGGTDMGLDYVRIVPPCSGAPMAGSMKPVTPCVNTDFQLELLNYPLASGITYQWQYSADDITYLNVPNGNQMYGTENISVATYFRCIVTCANSGLSDTTASYLATLAPFYMCYCNSAALDGDAEDIGNVTIKTQPANVVLLDNGVASPLEYNNDAVNMYTDFRTSISPVPLFMDSTYNASITEITSYSFTDCSVAGFIDYNRDGIFQSTEMIFSGMTAYPNQDVNANFTVPLGDSTGITGMRFILEEGSTTINPCGSYYYGETEDYLAELFFPNCGGPSNPGVAHISDTSMCPDYDFMLTDTTHQKNMNGMVWSWQESTDYGNNWTDIPNSDYHDTLTHTFIGLAWYRMKMVCGNSGDSTFSNVVEVHTKPPYKCYCHSIAVGGLSADSSDIGAFSFGDYVFSTTGPHLKNGKAIRGRTDNTDLSTIELYVDTTYEVDVYQILRSATHADAKITMFMDYNNNLAYDIPDERVFTVYTTSNDWYKTINVTIPSNVIPDVPTGLRVIINNNVGPNVPSDEACGTYTSGETEDYNVIFRKANPVSVGSINNLEDLNIYPNPTTGKFSVRFNTTRNIEKMQIRVTNVTGQQVIVRNYKNVTSSFSEMMDLGDNARGVYFVEIEADGQKVINKLVLR